MSFKPPVVHLVIAEDLMVEGTFPRVRTHDSLADVMKLLGDYRGEIPVLDNGRLAGVIWPEDVIARYNAEIFKRDMAGSMASAVQSENGVGVVHAGKDAVVAEIAVPPRFAGKTIRELDVRHVADLQRNAVLVTQHGLADVLHRGDTAALAEGNLSPGHVWKVAAGGDAVRLARGLDDFLQRQPVKPQLFLSDKDLVLGKLSADRHDL